MNEVSVVPIPKKPTCAGRPEQHFRHSKLLGGFKSESHDPVGQNTGHRRARRGRRVVELSDEFAKGSQEIVGDGYTERRDVLGGISITWWEAIWDGLKPKVREAIERVGASGPEQTHMVVFGVDKGDEKASAVKYFCQL